MKPRFKPFADDTSSFYVDNCVNTSTSTRNNDLTVRQGWAYQLKMSFNPEKKPAGRRLII